MTPEDFDNLNNKHPYLSCITFNNEDLIGIIQNMDNQLISIYVYNELSDIERKQHFLELGKLWWEDSNHLIPINIFLRDDMYQFKPILKCFSRKDIKDILGPTISLEDNFQKRIKRKRIQLIRSMD